MTVESLPVRYEQGDTLAGEIIASLPVSFRPAVASDQAGIEIVKGSDRLWPDAAVAALQRADRVVVIDPHSVRVSAIEGLEARVSARILLSETWAGNPILEAVRRAWSRYLENPALVEISIIRSGEEAANGESLLQAVRVLGALGLPVASLGVHTGRGAGEIFTGRLASGGLVTVLTAKTSADHPATRIAISAAEATIQVDLPSAATARPGRARLVTADGAAELPTVWQTAHRATFMRVRELIASGSPSPDLASFAASVTTLPATAD